MSWRFAGKKLEDVAANAGDTEGNSTPCEIDGEPYLIRSGYLVPFYEPISGSQVIERRRRERLNIELCNRVFRISDARDVIRGTGIAKAAIAELQYTYE